VLIYVNPWMEQALLLVVFARHPNRSDLKEAVMQRRQALELFAGLVLCPLCASTGFASEDHWRYEGATGPEKWGGLDAADAGCSAGGQQSPIDITAPISARQPPLRISWSKRPDTIVNNGHTIQLDFAQGDTLHMGDRRYALKQFHFHHPSEHLIEGKRFAMEVHFVHAGTDGLAVIGVVTSVVSAFYYLRVVKVMYFDEPVGAFDRPLTAELKGVLFVTAVVTLFFFILPGPIVGGAETAAAALFAR